MYRDKLRGKLKYPFLFIISIVSLMAICSYTIGYTKYLKEVDSKIGTTNENNGDTIKKANIDQKGNSDDKVVDASANDMKIINTTICKVIEVDLVTTRQSEITKQMPSYFVGLSREQLDKYYCNYMQNRPIEEVERGLQTINIISFAKEQVVIEKIYDASQVGYYIVDKAGEIKVYYNDKKTLYENTGITTVDLPESEKNTLENGIMVDSREEMLAILESYSS